MALTETALFDNLSVAHQDVTGAIESDLRKIENNYPTSSVRPPFLVTLSVPENLSHISFFVRS